MWCPFDKAESKYVTTFKKLGYDVAYGHIEDGQDFFDYTEPQGDVIVSNPPFSKRTAIIERLYEFNVPFAMVLGLNGLFDNRRRLNAFREKGVELLIPSGRMSFVRKDSGIIGHPPFQCIYVCHGILDEKIVFSEAVF